MEFSALDARLRELEQGLALIEQQVAEFQSCQLALEELGKIKKGNAMLAQLGCGIFVHANLADSEKLLINTGAKVLCQKSIAEAKHIINERLDHALDVHSRLAEELQGIVGEMTRIEQQLMRQQR